MIDFDLYDVLINWLRKCMIIAFILTNSYKDGYAFSCSSSCYFRLLLVDDERETLLEFKHGLIDKADRLASWVGDKNDCCNWNGIVCDNFTGHVHKIHLPGNCSMNDYNEIEEYEEFLNQKLRGDISPSLLNLTQLKHLDLSCNSFGEMEVPSFIGSLGNLRYLNLSRSVFGGTIPPQLGNLTELRVLCLGSFYDIEDSDEYEYTTITNMKWLSSLRLLHHLDLSGMDLSKATDWLEVINTLPSLVELHLSHSQLLCIDPYVANLTVTSLSFLDLSGNDFYDNCVLQWIFSKTSLVSLDLRGCGLHGPIPRSVDSFRNLTSLKSLHVHGNDFMSSSLVLKGLSSVGGNLISLDISSCGISSSLLGSLHNLTSILSLDLSYNVLNKTIPTSLGNLCNLRHIGLDGNSFPDISFTSLLESFFECKSPKLESLSLRSTGLSSHFPNQLGQLVYLENLQLENNHIDGTIPESIGRLTLLRSLYLAKNLISGPIPYSVGELSSVEVLDLSNNRLNGSLPDSLGQLSKIIYLDFSYNFVTGVVTEAHFDKQAKLKYLNGVGNYLSLRPRLVNWVPSFQLQFLYLSSWNLGPQFPLWLQLQRDLVELEISNTRITSMIHEAFWKSWPNLQYLNMSRNQIQGRLFRIPASLQVLALNSNELSGRLPELSEFYSQTKILDLSNNSFGGSLCHLVCPYGEKTLEILNLANNNLSGDIPECWEKWPYLVFLNLENNNLFGGIPRTFGSLSSLQLLNIYNNKLSGGVPTSLKNLTNLIMLQLGRNELVGPIPAWFGTKLLSLKILNLRSNKFNGNLTHALCFLTGIQILDLSHNNLSGHIPRCFNNFTLLSGKETTSSDRFIFSYTRQVIGSASLFIKGREDTYSTILGLVLMLDLSSNIFSGSIPRELMDLPALQSLNLSRNQLTGRIPENIGDLKSLFSFDVSLNRLSGELPKTLSSLNFLSSFNVSYNNLIGKIPLGTQLQSFNESCFSGNKLCGDPLTESCSIDQAPNRYEEEEEEEEEEDDESHGAGRDLIISIMCGFLAGFWLVLVPLIVSTTWRTAHFRFLSHLRCIFCNAIQKYRGNLLSR
ncbi:putative leucine-rich repeat-containing, plant-type, leucine-rich repeat domain superfamily [Helianthus annuus]|nr:putative leucine-rich repeat-containing, plant-type, leucine-rich repeat domain superfamily [Helianthus annuus]